MAWCIWILAILLVVASVDATPDTPALDQHFAAMKVPGPSGVAIQNKSGNDSSLVPFEVRRSIFGGDAEPERPAAFIAAVGQAADSSPPSIIESLVGPSQS
ncbi:MAG: hypothetical protein ACRD4E_12565 [Bryobacteraceae bacterium]